MPGHLNQTAGALLVRLPVHSLDFVGQLQQVIGILPHEVKHEPWGLFADVHEKAPAVACTIVVENKRPFIPPLRRCVRFACIEQSNWVGSVDIDVLDYAFGQPCKLVRSMLKVQGQLPPGQLTGQSLVNPFIVEHVAEKVFCLCFAVIHTATSLSSWLGSSVSRALAMIDAMIRLEKALRPHLKQR